MMLQRFGVALAVVLTGCVESNDLRTQPPSDPLDADWLDGASTISAEHLGRLLSLGRGDPAVVSVVTEAMRVLGGGRFEGLAARFSPCATTIGTEAGLTIVKSAYTLIPRTLDEIALGKRPPLTDAQLATTQTGPARDLIVTTEADFIRVDRTPMPEICIVPRLSFIEAYDAVVHELVHALRMNQRAARYLTLTAKTKPAFDVALVQMPGGELEAYTIGVRARLRVPYRGLRVSRVQRFFDPSTGQPFLTPEAFAQTILAPAPQGLGYAGGIFANTFEEMKRELNAERSMVRSVLEATLAERRANIDIFTANLAVHMHNIEAHRHNLEIAAATANGQLAATSRGGLGEAERRLAETHTLLDAARASEARLVGALASLDASATAAAQ